MQITEIRGGKAKMEKIRNTITGAVIIEGHVQGLSNARSLGEAGIPVIVVDRNNCIARYSRYCKMFYSSPDFDTDDFACSWLTWV